MRSLLSLWARSEHGAETASEGGVADRKASVQRHVERHLYRHIVPRPERRFVASPRSGPQGRGTLDRGYGKSIVLPYRTPEPRTVRFSGSPPGGLGLHGLNAREQLPAGQERSDLEKKGGSKAERHHLKERGAQWGAAGGLPRPNKELIKFTFIIYK